MSIGEWVGVASFVVTVLALAFAAGRWRGEREAAEKREQERAADAREREKELERRLEGELQEFREVLSTDIEEVRSAAAKLRETNDELWEMVRKHDQTMYGPTGANDKYALVPSNRELRDKLIHDRNESAHALSMRIEKLERDYQDLEKRWLRGPGIGG